MGFIKTSDEGKIMKIITADEEGKPAEYEVIHLEQENKNKPEPSKVEPKPTVH